MHLLNWERHRRFMYNLVMVASICLSFLVVAGVASYTARQAIRDDYKRQVLEAMINASSQFKLTQADVALLAGAPDKPARALLNKNTEDQLQCLIRQWRLKACALEVPASGPTPTPDMDPATTADFVTICQAGDADMYAEARKFKVAQNNTRAQCRSLFKPQSTSFASTPYGAVAAIYVPLKIRDANQVMLLGAILPESASFKYLAILKNILFVTITILAIVGILIAITTGHFRVQDETRRLYVQLVNQAIHESFTYLSHEIRNSLNAIMGLAYLIRNAPRPQDQRANMDRLYTTTRELAETVNGFFDLANLGLDNSQDNVVVLDIEKTIQEAMQPLSGRISQKNVNLLFKISPTIPEKLIGNHEQIARILRILFANALKIINTNGSILVTADEAESTDRDLLHIRFTIAPLTETSAGTSEQMRQSATTQARLGFAISLAKHLIEAKGGRIDAEGNDRGIFKITFELPFKKVESQSLVRQKGEKPRRIRWELSELDSSHILIVDDNAYSSAHLRDLLKLMSKNASVKTAISAADALAEIEKSNQVFAPYDLVLIRANLTSTPGTDLAREAHRQGFTREVHVLLIPIHEMKRAAELAAGSGVDGFIPTPLFPTATRMLLLRFYTETKPMLEQSLASGQVAKGVMAVSQGSSDETVSLKGRRALVVEDEEILRDIAQNLLESAGMTVTTAIDGVDGVEKFEAENGVFDVVLMDIQMPRMNGLLAAEMIRNTKFMSSKSIPILAITGNDQLADIEKAFKSGMTGYVVKPYDSETLPATISLAITQGINPVIGADIWPTDRDHMAPNIRHAPGKTK
jgi:CheY-like chemotaxis protein